MVGIVGSIVSIGVTVIIGLPWLVALLCPITAGAGTLFLVNLIFSNPFTIQR